MKQCRLIVYNSSAVYILYVELQRERRASTEIVQCLLKIYPEYRARAEFAQHDHWLYNTTVFPRLRISTPLMYRCNLGNNICQLSRVSVEYVYWPIANNTMQCGLWTAGMTMKTFQSLPYTQWSSRRSMYDINDSVLYPETAYSQSCILWWSRFFPVFHELIAYKPSTTKYYGISWSCRTSISPSVTVRYALSSPQRWSGIQL